MKTKALLPIVYLAALLGVLLIASQSQTAPEEVVMASSGRSTPLEFPTGYRDDFIHYLTVDRSDQTVRKIFINPEALTNLNTGSKFPIGTQIIIEAYNAQENRLGIAQKDSDGRYIPGEMLPFIHIAEKRNQWPREEIAASTTFDGWNFETFNAQTLLPGDENRADCFTCHDSGAFHRDFVFTRGLLEQFIIQQEQEALYFFCNRPERASCL